MFPEPVSNYYWRDYTGIIPSDAFPAGLDINNSPTYVGQGFVKDTGMLTGTIYPSQIYLNVTYGGSKRVDSFIKVSSYYTFWEN